MSETHENTDRDDRLVCVQEGCGGVNVAGALVCSACGTALVPMARPITTPECAPRARASASPLHLAKLPMPTALVHLAAVLGLGVIIPFIIAPIVHTAYFQPDMDAVIKLGLSPITKWLQALLVVALAVYFASRHRISAAAFGVRMDRYGTQVGWGLVAFAFTYVYLLGTGLVILPFLEHLADDISSRTEMFKHLPHKSVLATLMLLVPVALNEEVLFRGLLLPYLRRVTGVWWAAVLISSGIFGVLHLMQGVVGALQITGVSIIWSIFFIRTRSLTTVIVAHVLFDFAQFQLLNLLSRGMPNPSALL